MRPRSCIITFACAVIAAASAVVLNADLVVQGTGAPAITFTGHGGYSADALGQASPGGTVQAVVPAGSTVVQAFLYAATSAVPGPSLDVSFDGTLLSLMPLLHNNRTSEASYRLDVTAQVAAKVGSGGLPTEFSIDTAYHYMNGVALVVIYANPLEPEVTIYLLDGGLRSTGYQEVVVDHPTPIDPFLPDFSATLSLGISFSAQEPTSVPPGLHTCGTLVPAQSVHVSVNGQQISSCAGGADDGTGSATTNEVLITVGGVGDLLDNPADPEQTPGDGAPVRVLDDELYDITTPAAIDVNKLTLHFDNPSVDDQVFLAIIKIRTAGQVAATEGPYGSPTCTDTFDNDGDGSTDHQDSDCAPPPETCGDAIDNDGDGLIDGQDSECAVAGVSGKMTGGATVVANATTGIEATFTLHVRCGAVSSGMKDKLDVHWTTTGSKGRKKEARFVMDTMTSAVCTSTSGRFDTHAGAGIGKIDGTTVATISWELVDGGEPGAQDFARMTIVDGASNQHVMVAAPVKHGNIQAQGK